MELTEEAKNLIREECDKVLQLNKSLIREVNIYKWAARIFFTIALGGSITAFFKLPDYLDSVMTARSEIVDRLTLARSLNASDQSKDALYELMQYAEKMSSETPSTSVNTISDRNMFGDLKKASASSREIFFLTILETISAPPILYPEVDWFGLTEWKNLNSNRRFSSDVVNNPRWANNSYFLNRFAIATIKFAETDSDVARARKDFAKALTYATHPGEKAGNNFSLSQIALIHNQKELAIKYMSDANSAIPGWVKSDDLYFSSSESEIWLRIGGTDHRNKYKEAFMAIGK